MKFLVTGTQVYGPTTEKSDIDIVMSISESINLRNELTAHNINVTQSTGQILGGYPGFYFNLGKIPFNIVVIEDKEEFTCWEKATNALKKLNPIPDKNERIKAFIHHKYQ